MFLHALHLGVMFSNLFLWWFRKTLWLAQITLAMTLISWVGLGYRYGWGYCFLTEWQWQIKSKRGELSLPDSYIQYILQKLGFSYADSDVNRVVLFLFVVSILGCLWRTWRKFSAKAGTSFVSK
ncbi:DUF2784 family protein [Bdellovibrio bacteriovorus]|uniref:DUF2784 family protein n=1 Tax=Bdellovibrio bacteriovorus TaxID=959 RepID=UPI001D043B66|nr:DUF2784 family protein [Bdellovibrio bacteriovorus]